MDQKTEVGALLDGLRVLIVDDEFLIATDMGESFREDGAEVVGPFTTLADALKAAEEETFSVAILDYRLGSQTTETVADILMSRKIPFLFCSGGTLSEALIARLPKGTLMLKPVRYHVLLERVAALTGRLPA
ncbi:MAG TPA: response regulator [Magnetospirillaceae bacterium]|nr:response regulator [Magnetospirillaceae bacterium]